MLECLLLGMAMILLYTVDGLVCVCDVASLLDVHCGGSGVHACKPQTLVPCFDPNRLPLEVSVGVLMSSS